MRHITTVTDWILARYGSLPETVRQSALPFLLASIPMVISSALGAYFVMPLVVALTVVLIYKITQDTDSFMFGLSKKSALYKITTPLCAFISLWGLMLAFGGRHAMLNGVVGPYCLVLLLACAPAYRWNQERTNRRVSIRITFIIVGILAVLGSATHITA